MKEPWSVRGVREEVRAAAKSAAAAMGMALGPWLENAILAASVNEGLRRAAKKSRGKSGEPSAGDLDRAAEEAEIIRKTGGVLTQRAEEGTAPAITAAHVRVMKDQLSGAKAMPKKSRKKAVAVCMHGTMKGNNCWQCGGAARVQ